MLGDGLSLAGGEDNWTQHEELQDRTRDVAQHNKEQALKLPKVTNSVMRDGQVSQGLRRVVGNPIRDTR